MKYIAIFLFSMTSFFLIFNFPDRHEPDRALDEIEIAVEKAFAKVDSSQERVDSAIAKSKGLGQIVDIELWYQKSQIEILKEKYGFSGHAPRR